jgi:hypothetical protein
MEPVNLRGTLINMEYKMIDAALSSSDGNVAQAAKLLDLKRTTLIEKMRARLYRTQGGLYDPASPYQEIASNKSKREAQTNQKND